MAGKKSAAGVPPSGGPPMGKVTRSDNAGVMARFLAEWGATLVVLALVGAGAVGFTIYKKVSADLPVPTDLYVYLGVVLAVAAVLGGLRLALGSSIEAIHQRSNTIKESRFLVKEAERCLAGHGGQLSREARELVGAAADRLKEARDGDDWDATEAAIKQLDALLEQHFAPHRKSTTREYVESIAIAVLIALFLRSFVVEAFKIPSGSMIPTLQVGDHIFVNKFIYGVRIPWTNIKLGMGVRKPRRGEVIVFKFPKDQDKDFIKRIVAVEGDTVEIRNNQVVVNGTPVERDPDAATRCEYEDFDETSGRWDHRRCDAWHETNGDHTYTTIYDQGGTAKSWPKVTIPAGNVFVMGDNRDNSHDSRFWGTVPFELIKGKAMIIWLSTGEPEGLRLKRIGQLIE